MLNIMRKSNVRNHHACPMNFHSKVPCDRDSLTASQKMSFLMLLTINSLHQMSIETSHFTAFRNNEHNAVNNKIIKI